MTYLATKHGAQPREKAKDVKLWKGSHMAQPSKLGNLPLKIFEKKLSTLYGEGRGGEGGKGHFFFNSFQTNNEKTQNYRSLLWSQN